MIRNSAENSISRLSYGAMGIFSRGRGLIWLQGLLVICTAYVSPANSQNGFLSIDCGSDASYYDNSTGIFWETDANYISTGNNIDNITVYTYDPVKNPILNKEQVGSMRYFNDPRRRDCYLLPVEINETYLVRATFFYGSLGNASSTISFDVYMDNTYLENNEWTTGATLYESDYSEWIYSAPRSSLNFCLVRQIGPSFISALELRKLATGMYANVVGPTQGAYLEMVSRINLGPPETGPSVTWRYPQDTYDRIWSLFGINDNATHISNSTVPCSSNSFAEDPDRPPPVVMQDAWTYPDSNILSLLYNLPTPLGSVYVATYFQEVDGNASATNVRGMNYYLNNQFIESFNSSDTPLEIHGNGSIQGVVLNISFVQADWSRLRPILNAYEIYQTFPYNTSTTKDDDVSALSALQFRLNLTDWTGDPCLPVPFDWLSCSNELNPRITSLSLANQGYGGSIPLEILNLTALTYLTFSNNSFSGSIPDFSNLVHLQAIYLENNNLSGEIPSFLGSAFPNLTQLNLDNNNLDGAVPSDLINFPGLNFTALDNPSINCTIPACGAAVPPPESPPSINCTTPACGAAAPPAESPPSINCTTPACGAAAPPAESPPSINCTIPACGAAAPPPESPPPNSGKSSSSKVNIGAVVGGIFGGLVALAAIFEITWMLCRNKRRIRSSIIRHFGNAEYQSQGEQSISRKALAGSVILLTLQEVSDATKKFSRKIGEGSFGPVYYGKLPNEQEVAVKVRSSESRQGFQEFLNEVELLSRIHHRNLVSLVGYCEEGNQQILIYVYVPNGTLRDHLYGDKSRKPLDWRTRVDIVLNSARGLEYLHTDCNPRIIHRDVKSSNILLDENMVAKVTDFGISKQAPEKVSSGADTLLKGTPGYFDPEYFITQRLTQKSDVYSFGVVLFETISGRHPHVSDLPDGTTGTLIQWVRDAVNNDKIMGIVDPSLNGEFNAESMTKVITLAIKCIDQLTAHRPDMKQVVRVLTEAAELELFNEILIKTDQGTSAPIAEGSDEEQDDSGFTFEPMTEVPEVDPARAVLIPR